MAEVKMELMDLAIEDMQFLLQDLMEAETFSNEEAVRLKMIEECNSVEISKKLLVKTHDLQTSLRMEQTDVKQMALIWNQEE
ncbi:hypothetical protein NDU88_000676 [Pleurodeles waltl]|uniref:Uncharacterized protein n=1 Tax=Pleurodeles waltl TaxID=8319 RepID=A0AAV7VY12_PLEWA|nr:hypothetical protein NDU88_000676 [Pleurodeles waltl]